MIPYLLKEPDFKISALCSTYSDLRYWILYTDHTVNVQQHMVKFHEDAFQQKICHFLAPILRGSEAKINRIWRKILFHRKSLCRESTKT